MTDRVIRPFAPGDIDDLATPVVALPAEYPAGYEVAAHRHRRHQLVYACDGVMSVTTEAGAWVVPPERAVWMPAETGHTVRMHGPVSMRSLYIRADAADGLPAACRVVTVPALLRELILAAMDIPPTYGPDGPEARLMTVILDRIRDLQPAPLHLPMPADPRLKAVADALLDDPGDRRSLEDWAKTVGAGARTLARLFDRETAMTFRQWRRQARLMASLSRLAAGEPVTTVALDLGYDSPSAFIAMFREALGATPGRYFSKTK